MRKLVAGLVLLALLLAGAATLRVRLLDADALGRAVAEQAGALVGQPVRAERAALSVLPWPALQLADVRVGPDDAAPLLRARAARLSLSLPGLLVGRVILRSLELEEPRLSLGVDAGGWPQLPEREPPRAIPPGAGELSFLPFVTRVRVRGGSVAAGEWRLADVRADGGLGLDGNLSLELRAAAPGLGRRVEARLVVDTGADGDWNAEARILDLDLGGLRARLAPDVALLGAAGLTLAAEGAGALVHGGEVALDAPDLDLRTEALVLRGALAAHARLGGDLRVELEQVRVELPGVLAKPRGEPLAVSGRLGPALAPLELSELAVTSGPLALRGALRGEGASLELSIDEARADLAALAPWWLSDWHPSAGSVRIATAHWSPGTEAALDGSLDGVVLPPPPGLLPAEAGAPAGLRLDGPFSLRGSRLALPALALAAGGQRAWLGAEWDLASGDFTLDVEADALHLGPALEALLGRRALEGRLTARASFAGRPRLDALVGRGAFDVADGHVPGADFPWPPEIRDPRLVSGEEGRRFRHLAARFDVRDGVARFERLAFEHPYVAAYLAGDVQLAGGALDMAGELELSEELDHGLGGPGERRVLPVRRVGGTFADPELEMDPDAMAAVFLPYAELARARERAGEADAASGRP